MFHHELMNDDELKHACELLALLSAHPSARCRLMASLAQSHTHTAASRAASAQSVAHALETATPTKAART
jgi:hypothetical protein